MDKSKSHQRAKIMNSDIQTDKLADGQTLRHTDKQTDSQTDNNKS